MLSASILSSSLCHTLGDSQRFLQRYNSSKNTDFTQLSPIDLSKLSSLLPKANLRRVPRYARMGLLAAAECLQNASFSLGKNGIKAENEEQNAFLPKNLGLVIGTAFSSSQMNIDFMDSILDNSPELSSPTAFSHAVNNMGAGLISLILDIKGGCQTVTQFDHSFAGAIQTALLLLNSGKNDYVLVGAVDEIDSRFTYTCKDQLQTSPYAFTEGAFFLLLGKEEINKPKISVSWKNAKNITEIRQANPDAKIFLSGYHEDCQNYKKNEDSLLLHSSFYGTSPLSQALDTYLALQNPMTSLCICKQKDSELLSLLEINNFIEKSE